MKLSKSMHAQNQGSKPLFPQILRCGGGRPGLGAFFRPCVLKIVLTHGNQRHLPYFQFFEQEATKKWSLADVSSKVPFLLDSAPALSRTKLSPTDEGAGLRQRHEDHSSSTQLLQVVQMLKCLVLMQTLGELDILDIVWVCFKK